MGRIGEITGSGVDEVLEITGRSEMGALAVEVLAPLGTARQPINTDGPKLQLPCYRAR